MWSSAERTANNEFRVKKALAELPRGVDERARCEYEFDCWNFGNSHYFE